MKPTEAPLKCSICGQDIEVHPITGWAGGHNAEPINDGRCCDACNAKTVIPERLLRIYMAARQEPPK